MKYIFTAKDGEGQYVQVNPFHKIAMNKAWKSFKRIIHPTTDKLEEGTEVNSDQLEIVEQSWMYKKGWFDRGKYTGNPTKYPIRTAARLKIKEHNPNLPSINESYDQIGIDYSMEMSGVLDRDQELFNYLATECNFTALETNLHEIKRIVLENHVNGEAIASGLHICAECDSFPVSNPLFKCQYCLTIEEYADQQQQFPDTRQMVSNEEQLKTFSKAITMYLDGCPMTDTHNGQVQKLIDAGFRITKEG